MRKLLRSVPAALAKSISSREPSGTGLTAEKSNAIDWPRNDAEVVLSPAATFSAGENGPEKSGTLEAHVLEGLRVAGAVEQRQVLGARDVAQVEAVDRRDIGAAAEAAETVVRRDRVARLLNAERRRGRAAERVVGDAAGIRIEHDERAARGRRAPERVVGELDVVRVRCAVRLAVDAQQFVGGADEVVVFDRDIALAARPVEVAGGEAGRVRRRGAAVERVAFDVDVGDRPKRDRRGIRRAGVDREAVIGVAEVDAARRDAHRSVDRRGGGTIERDDVEALVDDKAGVRAGSDHDGVAGGCAVDDALDRLAAIDEIEAGHVDALPCTVPCVGRANASHG
jgi:hypothetical protein